ncbi:MAG TPA: nitrogen fixation protein [Candidatus Angelobacter sp.]
MSDKSKLYQITPANQPLLCPSAQPDMKDARLLGVVGGTGEQPELVYLNERVPVTEELLAQASPARPGQIFRIAAQCDENGCTHFDGTRCRLASRIVQILPTVTEALPACVIRPTCRWYQQEGGAACLRCPQVITETYEPDEDYKRAALGNVAESTA